MVDAHLVIKDCLRAQHRLLKVLGDDVAAPACLPLKVHHGLVDRHLLFFQQLNGLLPRQLWRDDDARDFLILEMLVKSLLLRLEISEEVRVRLVVVSRQVPLHLDDVEVVEDRVQYFRLKTGDLLPFALDYLVVLIVELFLYF